MNVDVPFLFSFVSFSFLISLSPITMHVHLHLDEEIGVAILIVTLSNLYDDERGDIGSNVTMNKLAVNSSQFMR